MCKGLEGEEVRKANATVKQIHNEKQNGIIKADGIAPRLSNKIINQCMNQLSEAHKSKSVRLK